MGPCFERSNKNSRREYLQNELDCVGVLLMPILEVVVAAAFSKPWAGIKCLDLSFARSVPTTHHKRRKGNISGLTLRCTSTQNRQRV